MSEKNPAAQALGRLGRSKNTEAQQAAAKANGAKGGRPKSAKAKYFDLAGSTTAAVEFEESVLQSGREFLPACALAVLDGEQPTDEYWDFLSTELNKANNT